MLCTLDWGGSLGSSLGHETGHNRWVALLLWTRQFLGGGQTRTGLREVVWFGYKGVGVRDGCHC